MGVGRRKSQPGRSGVVGRLGGGVKGRVESRSEVAGTLADKPDDVVNGTEPPDDTLVADPALNDCSDDELSSGVELAGGDETACGVDGGESVEGVVGSLDVELLDLVDVVPSAGEPVAWVEWLPVEVGSDSTD